LDVQALWEDRITNRVTGRILKNVVQDRSTAYPEIRLPRPKIYYYSEVQEIIDLTPSHIKTKEIKVLMEAK